MGNFNGTSGSHYTLGVSLSQGGVSGLTRDITVSVTMAFDGSTWYTYNNNDTYGYVTINGTQYDFTVDSFSFSSGVASTITLYSKTTTVQHDSNTGAAHVDVYAYYNADLSSSGKLTTASVSGSWDLTPVTIYRTVTVRKGTGISDITAPAWAWTGNYKTGSVAQGSNFNINCTTSTGYHWKNWSGSVSTTTQNYTFAIGQQNYDITANGEANSYTIKYDANGGSGSMSDTGATYGTAVTLRSNTFTRTHYTFKNWNTKADGTGTSYSNGASVSNLTATHGGTVTLYAQWTGVTYTVSYNANGGTSTPSSQSAVYPAKVTLASAISKSNTSDNGYTITYNANGGSGAPSSQTSDARPVTWKFSAWGAGGTGGSQYSAGQSYQPSSNITMYAIWNKGVTTQSSWTCSSTKPKKTGHTFLGWSTSSTATSATYASGTTYTITGDLTLYAVWQKNNYYLDVNGWLDGAAETNLGSYGTVDVYVNDVAVADNVSDYYTQHPFASTYEVKGIQANSGYQYNGVYEGTLTGTIGDNETTTGVRLNFSTTKPSNVTLSGNWTGPFNIDLQWSATGLNVIYQLYIISPDGSVYVQDCGTSLSTSVTTAEETTYQFYVEATNAGGTTKSNTITITTPADQAKIRRKVDGQWQKGKTYYKNEGTWKKVKKIYIKKDGVWYIGTNYDS